MEYCEYLYFRSLPLRAKPSCITICRLTRILGQGLPLRHCSNFGASPTLAQLPSIAAARGGSCLTPDICARKAARQSMVASMADASFSVWNAQNFDSEVLRHPGLAVVDFWSENCAPCKQLTRVLSQLSTEIPPSVRIGTVKVTDNLELAARFGIQATPTLLFFKGGALVDSRTGVDRRQVLQKLVETHA